jgi:predicted DNA-binding transcriptional regulator AlpA
LPCTHRAHMHLQLGDRMSQLLRIEVSTTGTTIEASAGTKRGGKSIAYHVREIALPDALAGALNTGKLFCLIVGPDGRPFISTDGGPLYLDVTEPTPTDNPARVLDAKEIAALLGVSKATITRAWQSKELRKVRVSKRRVGSTLGDVNAFIATRNVKPGAHRAKP